jgi:hypothetical protein
MEDMDLSTDNLPEMMEIEQQGKTQEGGNSRKILAREESSAEESGQGEENLPSSKEAGTVEQSRTEDVKHRMSRGKKIKLESGSARPTERKRSKNRTAQQESKVKM